MVPAPISGRCDWRVLPDLGSDHLPIHITIPISPVIDSHNRPPSFNYGKARWTDFQSAFEDCCPPLSDIGRLSLSEANETFTNLILDAATFAIPYGSINRSSKAWWSPEISEAVANRRKAFATAHRSEQDRQAYIAISRYTSTVIRKAKTEAWQRTCSSLSPKTRPSAVFSLLRSIAGKSSSPTDIPNFPGAISPVDCANQLSNHLKSHFSQPTPKVARGGESFFMNTVRHSQCNSCHETLCSNFSHQELSNALSQLSSSTASGPDMVPYPLLTHFPRLVGTFFCSSSTYPGLPILFHQPGNALL